MRDAPALLVPLAAFLVVGGALAGGVVAAVLTAVVVGALGLGVRDRSVLTRGPRAWLAALLLWAALDSALRPVAVWDAARLVASGAVALGILVVTAAPRSAAWGRLAAATAGTCAALWLVVERLVRAGRPTGPLGNANLAATLALLALALAPFLNARGSVRAALATVAVAGVVASGSRAALIGMVVVVAAWGFALRGSRWAWRAGAAIVGIAALGLAARLLTDHDPLRYERVRIWGVALRTVVSGLPFGWGPGGYADAALARNFPRDGEFARFARLPDVAESDLLELAATLGVPGVLLAAGLAGSVLLLLSRRDPRALGVLAAVAVTSTFSTQLSISPFVWIVALAVGGVLPRPSPSRRGTPSVATALAVAALAIAGGAVLASPDWGAGISPGVRVDRAEAVLRARPNDDAALADGEIEAWRACRARPRSARAWRVLGSVRLRRAMLRNEADLAEAAVRAFEHARGVNPLDAWAALGEAQALRTTGDAPAAWRALNAAVRLEPNFVSAWLERAILHLSAGEMGAARAALARAEDAARRAPRTAFVSPYEGALAWADPATVARLRSATGEAP